MDGLFNDGFRSAYVSTIVVKRVYVKYSQETHNLSIQFFVKHIICSCSPLTKTKSTNRDVYLFISFVIRYTF